MNKVIRLNERELHRLVAERVNYILMEGSSRIHSIATLNVPDEKKAIALVKSKLRPYIEDGTLDANNFRAQRTRDGWEVVYVGSLNGGEFNIPGRQGGDWTISKKQTTRNVSRTERRIPLSKLTDFNPSDFTPVEMGHIDCTDACTLRYTEDHDELDNYLHDKIREKYRINQDGYVWDTIGDFVIVPYQLNNTLRVNLYLYEIDAEGKNSCYFHGLPSVTVLVKNSIG